MAERVQANLALLKQRKELIEHVFGTIKRSMDQGYFLLRTRKKVAAEMSLTVLAYNLKRVITILGVKGLMAGLIERMASLWSIVWWLMSVPQWCKWIRRAACWGSEPVHQPTFHTVWCSSRPLRARDRPIEQMFGK